MSTQPWRDDESRFTPRPAVHRPCGLQVVKVDVDPDHAERAHARYLWLNPLVYPGEGDLTLTERGAVPVEVGSGDRIRHRCPAFRQSCRTCGQPILVLHRQPGAEFHLAFVDPEPVPDGLVILDADGVAWVDSRREYDWEGPRYRRHVHTAAERLAASHPRRVTVLGRAAA